MKNSLACVILIAALASACGAAEAHDSWFSRLGALADGEPLLALGTGNQFPVHEYAIAQEYLVRQGCRGPDRTAQPMRTIRVASNALMLRPGQPGVTGCWAQLKPFDIEVPPDKVDPYLDEINALPALRDTWAGMKARGLPWKERYTKHARIELQARPGYPAEAEPADMAVEVRRVAGPAPGSARAGDTLVFEVHRNGQPLAGLPLELRHATSLRGVWHRTDAAGRLQVAPALPGAWLLRGVELRVSATRPDEWDSDFVTLAFAVLPR